jgi:hypothetical protein
MAESKERPPSRTATDPSARQNGSEFDRFEALTGKLLRVPKKELDEKRKAKS